MPYYVKLVNGHLLISDRDIISVIRPPVVGKELAYQSCLEPPALTFKCIYEP